MQEKPSLAGGILVVRSEHPLVCQLIEQAVLANNDLQIVAIPFSKATSLQDARLRILILDTLSVKEWPEILLQWQSAAGKAIMLVSPQFADHGGQLQSLYLGAHGIISTSANIAVELPKAIRTVAEGQLWIGREVLSEYVERTNGVLRGLAAQGGQFTPREEQVLKLLKRGLGNRQISTALGISERTAKFHVSNILEKSGNGSRRELIAPTGVDGPTALGHLDLAAPRVDTGGAGNAGK